MAVKLRLRRLGRRKRPEYGVVAADARSPRDGRYIEDLGRYYPLKEPSEAKLKDERILYWLSQGAQASDTVRSILSREGLLLAYSLRQKEVAEDDIWAAVHEHREKVAARRADQIKVTPKERRLKALEEERVAAAAAEAEAARLRAAAEARQKEQAEAARVEAQEKLKAEREAAAEEAKREQEARNVAQAGEDAATGGETKGEPAEGSAAKKTAKKEVQQQAPTAEAAPVEAEAPPVTEQGATTATDPAETGEAKVEAVEAKSDKAPETSSSTGDNAAADKPVKKPKATAKTDSEKA